MQPISFSKFMRYNVLLLGFLLVIAPRFVAAQLPAIIDLNTSNSLALQHVFRVGADTSQQQFGSDLSNGICFGDFNGDGYDDMAIGSPEYNYNGRHFCGTVEIVFGGPTLAGKNVTMAAPSGFSLTRIIGSATNEAVGASVTCGDFNGDGIDDLAIGAPLASPNGRNEAGTVYIIYGSTTLPGKTLDLAQPVGTYGELRIYGGAGAEATTPTFQLGSSVAAGDINGDGIEDIIMGAPLADPGGRLDAGETIVYYGKSTLGSGTVDLNAPNGSNGETRILGASASDFCGFAEASGDFNGDGIGDLLTSAPQGSATGGMAYLLWGGSSLPGQTIDLSTAGGRAQVARFQGGAAQDTLGYSLAAGDVNGDGKDEAIISARLATPQGRTRAGIVYVFPGGNLTNTLYDLSKPAGTYGETQIYGENANDVLGQSAASADINGDGIDDLVLSAPGYTAPGGAQAGAQFVIYGSTSKLGVPALSGSVLSLSPNRNGVAVAEFGDNPGDRFGYGGEAGGDMLRSGFADFAGSAFTDDYDLPIVDNNLEYATAVFGAGTATSAQHTAWFRPGTTTLQGVDGRLSPVLRTWLAFTGGDNGSGGPSQATVTLNRTKSGISGLLDAHPENIAPLYWQITGNRTGFSSATVRFQYTDADISGLNELGLQLFTAPALSGPWTEPPQTADRTKNTIDATVSALGYFALLVPQQVAVVDQSSLNYKQWNISAGPLNKTLTISNGGQAELDFTAAYDFDGVNTDSFSIANTPDLSPLAPGASHQLTLAFDPSTVGSKSARLKVHTDDPANPTLYVALSGVGIDVKLQVDQTSLAWGARSLTAPPALAKTVTIHNLGTTSLSVSKVYLTSTGNAWKQFSIPVTPDLTPLAPGGSRQFSVNFTPTIAGTFNAALRLVTNDSTTPQFDVQLSGTALSNAAARNWERYQ